MVAQITGENFSRNLINQIYTTGKKKVWVGFNEGEICYK